MNFGITNFNVALPAKLAADTILRCNEQISARGLVLSERQAATLAEASISALNSCGRIEFGGETIKKLILSFSDSPFLCQNNFSNTVCELIDIFYYFKNETLDIVSDDRHISVMKDAFDGICSGDLEFLSGTVLDMLSREVKGMGDIEAKETEKEDWHDGY